MTQEITEKHNKIAIFQDRYNGFTYKKISDKYGISINTLTDRFSRGIWKEDYEKFEKELMDEGIKEAKKNLGKLTKNASVILAKALEIFEQNPELSVKSAIEILNRQFGKSVDIQVNMDGENFIRKYTNYEEVSGNKTSSESEGTDELPTEPVADEGEGKPEEK